MLAEKVRVLCWVMTAPGNHDLKAKHVKATWGKRCNILLFMSTEEGSNSMDYWIHSKSIFAYLSTLKRLNLYFLVILDKSLPAIKLSLHHEGRDTLWGKTKQSFQYIYDHYR